MAALLKIEGHDEERERDFELRCELEYTPEQRVHRMLVISRRVLIMAKKYATRKTYRIIQRT